MTKKLLNNFVANKKPKTRSYSEILLDFVIVGIASLIFNGFIVKDQSSDFDQKFFMIGNAMLLSTYWFGYIFFRQRHEKDNHFFRIISFFSILGLLAIGAGLDLMVFIKSSPDNIAFLKKTSMLIFLGGFIYLRLMYSIKTFFAILANKKNHDVIKLVSFKCLSRILNVLVGIIHISLVATHDYQNIKTYTYIFIPIYILIEAFGNFINITKKNVSKATIISFPNVSERFTKLTIMFISSIFTSGLIHFAFYFHNKNDLYMLGTLVGIYITGFFIWWLYSDHVYRFHFKPSARTIVRAGIINILIVAVVTLIGSMLINSHSNTHADFIIPTIFFALVGFLILIVLSSFLYEQGKDSNSMNTETRKAFFIEAIPSIIVFLIFGILSFFVGFHTWIIFAVVPPVLLITDILSRYTINKHKKAMSK